jgi:hypothetical protein
MACFALLCRQIVMPSHTWAELPKSVTKEFSLVGGHKLCSAYLILDWMAPWTTKRSLRTGCKLSASVWWEGSLR